MSGFPEFMTRDRPPHHVLIRRRVTPKQFARVLEAHTRFCEGKRDGRRAVFLRCDLSGLDLHGVDLSGADIIECDFTDADLSAAKLRNATLAGCCFRHCSLNTAELSGADLSRSDFALADLRGADLTAAKFHGTRLMGAEFGESPQSGLPTNIDTRILDRVLMQQKE